MADNDIGESISHGVKLVHDSDDRTTAQSSLQIEVTSVLPTRRMPNLSKSLSASDTVHEQIPGTISGNLDGTSSLMKEVQQHIPLVVATTIGSETLESLMEKLRVQEDMLQKQNQELESKTRQVQELQQQQQQQQQTSSQPVLNPYQGNNMVQGSSYSQSYGSYIPLAPQDSPLSQGYIRNDHSPSRSPTKYYGNNFVGPQLNTRPSSRPNLPIRRFTSGSDANSMLSGSFYDGYSTELEESRLNSHKSNSVHNRPSMPRNNTWQSFNGPSRNLGEEPSDTTLMPPPPLLPRSNIWSTPATRRSHSASTYGAPAPYASYSMGGNSYDYDNRLSDYSHEQWGPGGTPYSRSPVGRHESTSAPISEGNHQAWLGYGTRRYSSFSPSNHANDFSPSNRISPSPISSNAPWTSTIAMSQHPHDTGDSPSLSASHLSPTAQEFTSSYQNNFWNSSSVDDSTPVYVPPVEPLNYRRLLERNVSCDWNYIVGKIVTNNDQQASIFLQQKLKIATPEQKHGIMDAIVDKTYPLMINRFGNFLVQRCFEHGDQAQMDAIAKAIKGNTLQLSMDPFGCHVVQKALDCVAEPVKANMVHELLRRIPETVVHRYACHVWQKLFELRWKDSPPQIMKYVNEALQGRWTDTALGETGSLVVQNIFENCLPEDKRPCINEVLANIDTIARGQFGNWCIQHICEHGAPADRELAVNIVIHKATEYSTDQFASKVVEKCLKVGGTEFLDRYLDRVCESRHDRPRIPLIDIASDQYGNYLIQNILTHAPTQHREMVASHIRKHMVSLRGSKFGSRVGMLCCNGNFNRSTLSSDVGQRSGYHSRQPNWGYRNNSAQPPNY